MSKSLKDGCYAAIILAACAHGSGFRVEAPTVSEYGKGCREPEREFSDYKLQAWDDRFFREELVPAIRSFNAGLPEMITTLLYQARAEVSRARNVSALRAPVRGLDAWTEGLSCVDTVFDPYCMSPYATDAKMLDIYVERARTVSEDDRRTLGAIIAIRIMDVLGVASRGELRMAMAMDVPEAGPLAGQDDDLFGLLQGTSEREYMEETPGPNYTVATIPHDTVLRLVKAIGRVNAAGENSNCFTRSMELVLMEASQPERRLVVVAE